MSLLQEIAKHGLADCEFNRKLVHFTDKPCAAKGLLSYRYMGRFGFIMIGALSDNDALKQAQRSTSDKVTVDHLEFWNGSQYQEVITK